MNVNMNGMLSSTVTSEQGDDVSEVSYRQPTTWRSCCFELDSRMILFTCQYSISIFILLFCLGKLWVSDTCESQSLYGNIVITLIGLWMPSPMQ
jgi:hypothetical protein